MGHEADHMRCVSFATSAETGVESVEDRYVHELGL